VKCSCGVAKHWSGAHCEMDKFDEMIGFLAAVVPSFCQARLPMAGGSPLLQEVMVMTMTG
jgi:hypothetical protein